MVSIECEACGTKFDRIPSLIERAEHHFCSTDCQNRWQSEYNQGKNNPSWSGGKSEYRCEHCSQIFKEWPSQSHKFCSMSCKAEAQTLNDELYDEHFYRRSAWRNKRTSILKRDSEQCKWCENDDRGLHVHHLRPVSAGGEKFDESNLVSLCQECHSWAHKALDY